MYQLLLFILFLSHARVAIAAAMDQPSTLASTPQFRKLTVEEGLPSSKVYKLAQDRDGFLWMGTDDGLARYDGVQFQVWRHDANDPTSLANNIVSTLYIDPNNRLWCGGEDAGLNLLDAERRHFQHFRHDDKDPASLTSNDVWTIAQDVEGTVWVGGYGSGLDRLQLNQQGFDHHRHDATNPDSIGSDNLLSLLASSDGRLWIGTEAGLDRRERNGKFHHVDLSVLGDTTALNVINLIPDSSGVIAATARGAVRVDTDLHAELVSLPGNVDSRLYSLVRDTNNDLWMGSRHGLIRQRSNENTNIYRANPYIQGELPGEIVFDALRDHESGLWFALLDGGVVHLPPQWRNFSVFRHLPEDLQTLSANAITGFSVDKTGNLWTVNVSGAIDRLDPQTGLVERYTQHFSSPQKNLLSILATNRGQIWVGHQKGLRVYELKTGNFHDIPMDTTKPDALPAGFVDQITEDHDSKIWVSAHGGGLTKIDPETLVITRFTPDNGSGLRSNDIEQFGFTAKGELLVATALGVDWFDAASQTFHAFDTISAQRIHAFAFAPDGTLWLHRLGALEQYRLTDGKAIFLQRIDAADGWPTLIARGLELDSSGVLWVASPRGLLRVDPQTHAIRSFDSHDGLPSSELRGLTIGTNGHLFATTLASGVFAFNPLILSENSTPPPLLLTGITLRREANDLSLNPDKNPLALRWDDRDIHIESRALSYANTSGNRYQFQLTGFDSEWINTGKRGAREFNQLPPGKYQLNMRAANASGIWSHTNNVLQINVAPPPWKTWWAYSIYVLAVALVIATAFRLYQQRIQRRYQLELTDQQRHSAEQASAAKSNFLATMGHEIRTPMTGVLGMTELLLRTPLDTRQLSYAEAIQKSGQLMLKQVNDALDLARIEAGMINLHCEPFNLVALLREAVTFLEPLATRKSLVLETTVSGTASFWRYGDALRVKQILLNLGNNAIKFTELGNVHFELLTYDDHIEINIRDTGPGISADTLSRLFQPFVQADGSVTQRYGGSGLGLAICRELASCMGGDIHAASELGEGSVFKVSLPLRSAEENKSLSNKIENATSEQITKSKNILHIILVEDDATVARVIQEMLESAGHTVHHCPHGLAAIAELAQGKVNIALIDIDLPGIDGYTLARMWRTRESTQQLPHVPLIAITARSGGNEETQAMEAGMDGFLRKPLTTAQLLAAIEMVVPLLREEKLM